MVKSLHVLLFFIALFLLSICSASPESSLNPLIGSQQHLKHSSFSVDNLPENVETTATTPTTTTTTTMSAQKALAWKNYNDALYDVAASLMPPDDSEFPGFATVGLSTSIAVKGKRRFENGTMNEYVWEVDTEATSKYILYTDVRSAFQIGFDDIPDLFVVELLLMESGNQMVQLRNIRKRDGDVKDTRTVIFDCLTWTTIFVNDIEEREEDDFGVRDYYILFPLKDDKPDYNWVKDDTVSSQSIELGSMIDPYSFKKFTNYKGMGGLYVKLAQTGKQTLKFKYQNPDGTDILQTATIIFNFP